MKLHPSSTAVAVNSRKKNLGPMSSRRTAGNRKTIDSIAAKVGNNRRRRRQQQQKFETTFKMKMKAIGLGFILGLCTYNMLSLIHQSDIQLRHSTQVYDMAFEIIPHHYYYENSNSTTTTSKLSSCNNTTTTTKTLYFESIKKLKDQKATKKITNPLLSTATTTRTATITSNDKTAIIPLLPPTYPNVTTNRTNNSYKYVKDFDPNLPAVLVTKIHSMKNLPILQQSICLLTYAYNNRVNYDIIVFYSEPITSSQDIQTIQEIQQLVYPAQIKFVIDNPGLQQMIEKELSAEQQSQLLQRCGNVPTIYNLTWYTKCLEVCSTYNVTERISYAWQAEFRSKWIWIHPAISKYQFMLWFDSDAFCTQVWNNDPLGVMARHNLAVLFDNFPQGHSRGHELPYKIQEAFDGKIICNVDMYKNGTLYAKSGHCIGKDSRIKLIHGFLHVTNLEFYRSPAVQKWTHALISTSEDGTKFSRQYDDQIAVTVPAAILAGNRSWDMRKHSIELQISHNGKMDGKKSSKTGNFVNWWKENGLSKFPEAYQKCNIVAGQ